jgi:hypothetical protein
MHHIHPARVIIEQAFSFGNSLAEKNAPQKTASFSASKSAAIRRVGFGPNKCLSALLNTLLPQNRTAKIFSPGGKMLAVRRAA